MRQAIATPEAVSRAAEEILATGQELTAEGVRERLGGGSYTTINKLLREYRDGLEKAQAANAKLSDGVARVIHDAVARAAAILEAESNARVDAISRSAIEAEEKLKRELSEAVREVGRLELALESAETDKTEAQSGRAAAEKRETEASGRLKEMQARIDSHAAHLDSIKSDAQVELARERQRAQEAESKAQAAIEEAAELRGQLSAFKQAQKR